MEKSSPPPERFRGMEMAEAGYRVGTTPHTINAAFGRAAARYSSKTALLAKGSEGKYQGITFGELDSRVDKLVAALQGRGIGRGDRVAILSYHGSEWAMADLAILRLGGVVVPIYHALAPSAVKYIINDSASRMIFVENEELREKIERIRDELPSLQDIVVFRPEEGEGRVSGLSFQDLMGAAKYPGNAESAGNQPVSTGDIATIVYTSGTTGEPKGVVLSHGNIVSNAFACASRFRVSDQDVFLSFLPLCHMFERTCGYYTMLFSGATIAYAGDLNTIIEDVRAIRPTILIIVPRILEKIYEAVEKKVRESSLLRRKLVTTSIQCLNQHKNLEYRGLKVPLHLRLKCRLANTLVAAKFREIAGGRLRLLVSGGAPLDKKLSKTLYDLGFNILEGYGLTETSPAVCTSCLDDNRLGTVGKPIAGVEVKIGERDEILVRGPNVMQGYYNQPQATKEAVDGEGWFHTGDQGRFDENGNLVITGRIKELIITSYGKNVAPVPLEAEIIKSGYIEQCLLCGDNRKYITALVVPAREAVEQYAEERNIGAAGYEELLEREEIMQLVAGEIESATADRARFEKVRKFVLLAEPFTVENELLTLTLKMRRKKVRERFAARIDSMYVES